MNYFLIKQGWKITNREWCPHQGALCTEGGEYLFYNFTNPIKIDEVCQNSDIINDLCKDLKVVMKESI